MKGGLDLLLIRHDHLGFVVSFFVVCEVKEKLDCGFYMINLLYSKEMSPCLYGT
jgi:hypothetical protein